MKRDVWREVKGRRAAFGIVALGTVAAAFFAMNTVREATRAAAPGSEETVPFTVEPGLGLGQVARRLEAAEIVRDARAVVWIARWRGWEGQIQAGEYALSPGATPEEVLRDLISGRVRTYTAVLPEGIRATEIAARLEEAGLTNAEAFLAVVKGSDVAKAHGIAADSLEGYLYPETYEIPRNLPPRALAEILVSQFDEVWAAIEPEALGHDLSKHEIVTLASIVEKETAAPGERPLIASVFLNRLAKGMRLETDPTVIYGIENFDGNITRSHLRDKTNPYNTYQIRGLPPGPIASPGSEALRAVVKPADSDYLYFVSKNDGTHQFSETYREHVNAVNYYQKNRRNRNRSRTR